jgi:hypothetical protein
MAGGSLICQIYCSSDLGFWCAYYRKQLVGFRYSDLDMFFDLFYSMVCHLEHVVLMVKDTLHPLVVFSNRCSFSGCQISLSAMSDFFGLQNIFWRGCLQVFFSLLCDLQTPASSGRSKEKDD